MDETTGRSSGGKEADVATLATFNKQGRSRAMDDLGQTRLRGEGVHWGYCTTRIVVG